MSKISLYQVLFLFLHCEGLSLNNEASLLFHYIRIFERISCIDMSKLSLYQVFLFYIVRAGVLNMRHHCYFIISESLREFLVLTCLSYPYQVFLFYIVRAQVLTMKHH